MSQKPSYRPHGSCYITTARGVIQGTTVEEGFVFDGASIPRPLWAFLGGPFHPRVIDAACVHDWMVSRRELPRTARDKIFRAALVEANHKSRTWLYAGLRMFGPIYDWLQRKE